MLTKYNNKNTLKIIENANIHSEKSFLKSMKKKSVNKKISTMNIAVTKSFTF